MSDLRVSLVMAGDLEEWANSLESAITAGLGESMRKEAKQFERLMEQETAVLGQGVMRSWDSKVYLNRQNAHAALREGGPAAFIFSRAPHIVDSHSEGADIRAKKGRFLWIPIKGSPADKPFRKRTPLMAMKSMFGADNIQVIRLRSGRLMAVAKASAVDASRLSARGQKMLAARGGFGRAGKIEKNVGRGKTRVSYVEQDVTVPLFFLVRNSRLEKVMDWRGAAEREEPAFEGRLARTLEQTIAQNLARKGIRA